MPLNYTGDLKVKINNDNMIEKLVNDGHIKNHIAKACGVTWQTVHMWHKGAFSPKPENMSVLRRLLKRGPLK